MCEKPVHLKESRREGFFKMDDDIRLSWIIAVIILLLIAAYFAVSETAFASASRTKIKTSAERGDANARKALYVLDHFDRAITTILIGTNIVHLSAAAIVTANVTRIWGLSAVTLSTIVTTIVVFFAGEMLPKSIGKKNPERYAKSTAALLIFFMKLFTPASAFLTKVGEMAARLTKGDPEVSVTEDELHDIIDDMTEQGSLDQDQGSLLSSALQFGDITAESILTPRVDMDAIEVNTPVKDIVDMVKKGTHSRYPVYEGTIDNIIGVLQIRSFLKKYIRQGDNLKIRDMLDDIFYVHQSTEIDELLQRLTRQHLNMAVVTDNYGGTLGIVTIENIVEVLVGDIWDEDDIVEEPIKKIGENRYLVDADETVKDFFDEIDYEDPEDNEELLNTLMGEWTFEQFDEIPEEGDSFRYHNLKVKITEMDHRRILQLMVKVSPEPKADQADESGDRRKKDLPEEKGKDSSEVQAQNPLKEEKKTTRGLKKDFEKKETGGEDHVR